MRTRTFNERSDLQEFTWKPADWVRCWICSEWVGKYTPLTFGSTFHVGNLYFEDDCPPRFSFLCERCYERVDESAYATFFECGSFVWMVDEIFEESFDLDTLFGDI